MLQHNKISADAGLHAARILGIGTAHSAGRQESGQVGALAFA
jgi:hypothetical protein